MPAPKDLISAMIVLGTLPSGIKRATVRDLRNLGRKATLDQSCWFPQAASSASILTQLLMIHR